MRIDIMTLFPESLTDVLADSILGRAQERGYLTIEAHQIRDYTASKQNQVDDYPYGGGRGAIMQADPIYRCWEAVCDEAAGPVHTVYLSPCGHTFQQADAIRLLNEACPSKEVLQLKAYESFMKAADGQATKIIIPSEIQGMAGLATSVKELVKE